jgi:hypothetical protein
MIRIGVLLDRCDRASGSRMREGGHNMRRDAHWQT